MYGTRIDGKYPLPSVLGAVFLIEREFKTSPSKKKVAALNQARITSADPESHPERHTLCPFHRVRLHLSLNHHHRPLSVPFFPKNLTALASSVPVAPEVKHMIAFLPKNTSQNHRVVHPRTEQSFSWLQRIGLAFRDLQSYYGEA